MDTMDRRILLLLVVVGAVCGRPTSECSNKAADVVFVLDTSNSIWLPDFRRQISFVQEVVKRFDVGPLITQTRVGVLTFGHDVWRQFNLNEKLSSGLVQEALEGITHGRGRTTNTGDAIKYAVTNMFTKGAGHRDGVTPIMVVITDGRSQKTRETKMAAMKAHDSGIEVFAVGVGTRLDFAELSSIASDPDEQHLFLVNDYGALTSITDELTNNTCAVTALPIMESTTTPTVPPTSPTPPMTTEQNIADQSLTSCGGKPADVFFLVDSSSSIQRKDFNKEVGFVKDVVEMFDVADDKTRVGVISFSQEASLLIGLDNSLSQPELLERIDHIKHIGGGTNTAEALRLLRQVGFASGVARAGVAQIAIVLTDGLSADEDLTAQQAELTHAAGVSVFAIGIGAGVDGIELKNIASDPDDNYVLRVGDFGSLDSIKDVLAVKTCQVKPAAVEELPNHQPVCSAKTDTDMMFIYDSTSLGASKSRKISQFIGDVLYNLDLTSSYLRVGRTTDNCPSGGNFDLSDRLSAADFSRIQVASYSHLLKKLRRSGFHTENGARADSTKLSVLFIDSNMDGLDNEALMEAIALGKSTELFVVAIGNGHMITRFSRITRERNFVQVNSYKDLHAATSDLLHKLCYFYEIDFLNYDIDYVVPV